MFFFFFFNLTIIYFRFRDRSDKFNAIKSKALHMLQSFEKNLDAINILLKDDETEQKWNRYTTAIQYII